MMKKQRGMTLLELLVAMAIVAVLMAMSGLKLKNLMQRAKVAAAKSTISGFEAALGSLRNDNGIYPSLLSDTKEADAPAGFSANAWYGPYAENLSLTDPWGNTYYYTLLEGVTFGPTVFERVPGPPTTENDSFSATPGSGTLIISNSSVSSARVWLNGVETVSPDEFGQSISSIEKNVTLQANNTVSVRITGSPGDSFILSVTCPDATAGYILLSYGQDGEPGGLKFAADIIKGEF